MKLMAVISSFFLMFIVSLTSFAQDTNETSLNIKLNTINGSGGFPSFPIEIQGKTFPVLVDTGASEETFSLTPKILRGIHYNYTGKQHCVETFYGRKCLKEINIPRIKIGNFTLYNIKGKLDPNTIDAGNYSANEAPKNGAVGLLLLSKFNVLLDYPHSKILLVKKGSYPEHYVVKNWMKIPFELNEGIITKAMVNKNRVKLVWDTGALPSRIATKKSGMKKSVEHIVPVDVKFHNQNLPATKFLVCRLPGFVPFDGMIGSNFYEKNIVFFDFHEKAIYVKPYA